MSADLEKLAKDKLEALGHGHEHDYDLVDAVVALLEQVRSERLAWPSEAEIVKAAEHSAKGFGSGAKIHFIEGAVWLRSQVKPVAVVLPSEEVFFTWLRSAAERHEAEASDMDLEIARELYNWFTSQVKPAPLPDRLSDAGLAKITLDWLQAGEVPMRMDLIFEAGYRACEKRLRGEG